SVTDYSVDTFPSNEILRGTRFPSSDSTTGRAQIASPQGREILLALRDSLGNATGTYSSVDVRRYDAGRTRVFQVPGKGPVNARDTFNVKPKPGPPRDADLPAPPADGTMVADTTASKLWVRIGGAWKSVAVA